MKFESINRKYTEIVNEYIGRGYYINAGTMAATEGEIAHIDLTNGMEIVRVLVDKFSDPYRDVEGIKIVVGRSMDGLELNASRKLGNVIWNDCLDVIKKEEFFLVSSRNRSEFFGTYEEATEARNKRRERFQNRPRGTVKTKLPEDAKYTMLKFIKKLPRCKSVKLADVGSVYSVRSINCFTGKEEHSYIVNLKGVDRQILLPKRTETC